MKSISSPARILTMIAVLAGAVSCAKPLEQSASPPEKALPHILLINSDDLGWMDVGLNTPAFRTPNIDKLAGQGIHFTNAYMPAANCAPSRAAMHSGMWTPRHGVYTVGDSERSETEYRRLIPVENTPIWLPSFIPWRRRCATAGIRSGELVNGLDIYPTLMDVTGLSGPSGLDGVSLLPLMQGSKDWKPVTQFWHFPIYLQAYDGHLDEARDPLFRTRPGPAMRQGKWKLHEYFEDGALELYDLENDPGERNNLVDELPEKAAELHQVLRKWRAQTNAPVPKGLNPEYDKAVEAAAINEFE